MILELCKGVHCVDLDESFQTHIYLQNLASIQPRTSPLKFVGSRPRLAPAYIGALVSRMHAPAAPAGGQRRISIADDSAADPLQVTTFANVERRQFAYVGSNSAVQPSNFEVPVLGCIEAKFCR